MTLPRLSEQQPPLLTYQIEDGEPIYEAITEVFGAIGVEVYEEKTTIEDWTNGLFDLRLLNSEGPHRVSTIIWDHPIVITPDEIRIYEHL